MFFSNWRALSYLEADLWRYSHSFSLLSRTFSRISSIIFSGRLRNILRYSRRYLLMKSTITGLMSSNYRLANLWRRLLGIFFFAIISYKTICSFRNNLDFFMRKSTVSQLLACYNGWVRCCMIELKVMLYILVMVKHLIVLVMQKLLLKPKLDLLFSKWSKLSNYNRPIPLLIMWYHYWRSAR